MNKKLYRFITTFMVLAIIISSNLPVFASKVDFRGGENDTFIYSLVNESSDMEQEFPEIREINKNTLKLLEEGYTTEEIMDNISDDDYRTLISAYKEADTKAMAVGKSSLEQINEFLISSGVSAEYIEEVEALAAYYQEYYEENQSFPDETSIESYNIEPMSAYDPALKELGYYVTATTLAQQLAKLGIICSSAFPYVALLALLVGATMLSVVIYDYVDNRNAVESSVAGWYTGSRKQIKYAGETTAALVTYRILYNIKYWRAHLITFAGLGGIAVSVPMSEAESISWLSLNTMNHNTYSVYLADATNVARKTGNANPYMDVAHRGSDGKQILNMKHLHPVRNGQRMKSHCFYGFL